ncbi:MAG: linear amide C-N hydrolase [Acidobacteriota bacterium]
MILLAALAVLASWLAPSTQACTNIVLRNGKRVVFGSNFDWNIEGGLVFVNQRSMTRRSIEDPKNNPAHWVSRYGSVTFNQAGRDLPIGGINEAGLIVASMLLHDTRYPSPDKRAALDNLEWIQYQLDTSASVSDVIASDHDVRIAGPSPLHYLVADRSGAVATIEILDGRMVVHQGARLPVAALTNSTYDVSLQSIEGKTFHWWSWWPWGLPWGRASLDRFAVAAGRVQQFQSSPSEDDVDYAFHTLRGASQGGATPTQWSIVYEETPHLTLVHFRTRQNSEVKTIDVSRLNFACSGSAEWMDMQREAAGDVTSSFQPYTYEKNLELVRSTFSRIDFLRNLPDDVVERIARNPSSSRCAR